MRLDAYAGKLVRVLVAMAAIEADAARAEFAAHSRTGAGGVAFAAGEVRRLIRACLHGKNVRQAPAADDEVRDAVHRAAEHLAAAEGQVVKHRSVPAQAARTVH